MTLPLEIFQLQRSSSTEIFSEPSTSYDAKEIAEEQREWKW